jgi:hypothetical protein
MKITYTVYTVDTDGNMANKEPCRCLIKKRPC